MNAMLNVVPFFLAARVAVDGPWQYGPQYTFQVQVNSTAIPEEGSYISIHLNVASKLVCQPKGYLVLSCHFCDSKADSYATESLYPGAPAVPVSRVSSQEAYEMNDDQFEIKFSERGLDSLVMNENVQPRELDMIRLIVCQLSIGALDGEYDQTFELMENFTQGECLTILTVERNVIDRALQMDRDYVLHTVFELDNGQLVQIKKIRNLQRCIHKVPYCFGSVESVSRIGDVVSSISSSESHIAITSTEFISGTTNVVATNKVSEGMVTTLYENISVRLKSISSAKSEPPKVKNPEPASMFIGRWQTESSVEVDTY